MNSSTTTQVPSPGAQPRPPASTARSVFANWAGLALNAVLSLILTPILVHGLGNLYFGMFMLVASVLDSCWLLDFGMRTTMFRFVARYRGSDSRHDLDVTFASGLTVAVASALAILLLSGFAVLLLPYFFGVQGGDRSVFRFLLALSGASVTLTFVAQFLGTYLCAFRRFDLYNLTSVSAGLLRALLIVAVLRLHWGVLAVAVATLLSSLVALLMSVFLLRKGDPLLGFHFSHIQRSRMGELLGFSTHTFLGTVGDQLRFFVDSAVIGRVLGVALITPFVIPGRLVVLCRQLALALASPMAGVLSELEGKKQAMQLREYFLRATRLCALLSLFLGLMLLVNGGPLIRLWVGGGYAGSYRLLAILLAGYTLMLAQQPSVDLLIAKGRHHWRGWWTLAEGLANLGLSIYWAKKWGLAGIALGTAVPMLAIQLLVQPWYALRILSMNLGAYLREALGGPVMVGALYLALCAVVRPWQHAAGVFSFALMIAWQTAWFALLTLAAGITRDERRQIFHRGLRWLAGESA